MRLSHNEIDSLASGRPAAAPVQRRTRPDTAHALSAVVAVLLLTGCGAAEDDETAAPTPPVAAATTEVAASEPPPEPEPPPNVADFATEADACRSVTASEWVENSEAVAFHRKGSAVHVEATEDGGLTAWCRYTTDGGELLKAHIVEFSTTAAPSDRFMRAAAYLLALFAADAAGWFEDEVRTRRQWPAGTSARSREMTGQTVTVFHIEGAAWQLSITRDADYTLQD